MLVGIYVRDRLSTYVFHNMSSSCGGVNLYSFCLPISAMSLFEMTTHYICVVWVCIYLCSNGLLYDWD